MLAIMRLACRKPLVIDGIFRHFQGSHGTETEQVLDPSCDLDTIVSGYLTGISPL